MFTGADTVPPFTKKPIHVVYLQATHYAHCVDSYIPSRSFFQTLKSKENVIKPTADRSCKLFCKRTCNCID